MKNTIRCCISCILPCGALDVIRIVHPNGHVEELSDNTTAAEILKLHPKHVLKKHTSEVSDEGEGGGVCHRVVIVSPESKLQRGKIYFLIPLPDQRRSTNPRSSRTKRKKNREHHHHRLLQKTCKNVKDGYGCDDVKSRLLVSDRYLSEILSEKVISTQRDRRRGRVAVWRPHLESISETPSTEV